MDKTTSRIIVKRDGDNIVIFSLDTRSNPGNIWCNDLGDGGDTLMSGCEASYEYYLSTKPATAEDTARAISALQKAYPKEVFEARKKITETDRKTMWSH